MMSQSTLLAVGLEVGVDVLVKGSLVIGAAFAISFLLGKRSAATRDVVWRLAFAALLVLPVMATLLPEWRVGALQVHITPTPITGEVVPRGEMQVAPPEMAIRPADLRRSPGVVSFPAARVARILVTIWAAGTLVFLARVLIDLYRVRGIVRRADMTDRRVSRLRWSTATIAARLGIRRPVGLAVSDDVQMPSSVGVWQPLVLVPTAAADWDADCGRAVLIHELAHVGRWDYVQHLVVETVRALYWPNPLVWFAARRQTMERERACDDHTLRLGVRSTTYVTTLLEMALSQVAPSGALAMARQSQLAERIWNIMSKETDRSPLSRQVGLLAAVGAALVAIPVAAFDVWQMDQQQSVEQLIGQLQDQDPAARRHAAWALGEREDPRGVGPLAGLLDDGVADVRLVAAWALGEIKDRSAIQPLEELLEGDPDILVREMAALALGEMEDPAAVRALMSTFRETEELRGPVVWALGEIEGDAAMSARATAFDEWRRVPWDNEDVWMGDVGSRGSTMSDDVAVLVQRLADGNPEVRRWAAWNLGLLNDVSSVDPLLDAMRDPDPSVRAMAVWALDEINPSDEQTR
jgi:beta-lactamase regulating signal transducer with metallopeptidase domain